MANSPFPLALNDRGEEVAALQENLHDLGYSIPGHEHKEQVFGVGTQEALLKFQAKYSLRRTGAFDDRTKPVLSRAINVFETDQNHVEGRILLENGQLAQGVELRLYNQSFGGKATRLATTKTDERGFYHFAFDLDELNGKTANLEVRLVDGEDEKSLSKTKLNAERYEILNLVAPASLQSLGAEYKHLTTDLKQHLDDLKQLANARETEDRHDLSLLHQATHWDARLIALAALAFKRSPETEIPPKILYALFRVGLPSDKQILARVNTSTVKQALKKARKAGIIRLNSDQLGNALTAFETFAHRERLETKAPGALSTMGEMLAISGLTPNEQDKFADLYFAHRGTPAELWQATYNILDGTDEEKKHKINGLRLESRLASFTFNNAPLTQWLHAQIESLDNLTWLVEQGFYQNETWENQLTQLAGTKGLETIIPPAYSGDTPEDRLAFYAADLARRVHLNYPTQVVGQLIHTDELRLSQDTETHEQLKTPVYNLLKQATQHGFELGRQSLTTFERQHPEVFAAADAATLQSIKRLQRLYQITPTDKALIALFDLGFTSANEIAALDPEYFLSRAKHAALSEDDAKLVYRKAQQVSVVTLNLVTMAQLMDSAPPIYGIFPAPESPSEARREGARKNLIKHYPSLETLFGSVDFCECEHCRSVLSPAAYFVDLLQFLEQPQNGTDTTPYDVLTQRRPDLPHLELTCENTHTALPYIDIVNEILEYWVAHDQLDDEAVHDTGDATTPELLAEPQNILPEAYDILRESTTCYPLNLPFDLWLETVRQFLNHFETPLWQLLELLRPTDELFDTSVDYDRAAILAEYLGISLSEYTIFTNPPQANWYSLYGYKNAGAAKDNKVVDDDGQRVDLNSAKTLSRKLGVSYKELVELVATGFVNPNLDALVVLQKLGVDAEDVLQYLRYDSDAPGLSDAEKYRLAREHEAFQQRLEDLGEQYNFDFVDWISSREPTTFEQILILLDRNSGCDFNITELKFTGSDPAGRDVDELVFLKLNLFVRLWKKLGWTIEETDQALKVFLPGGIQGITTTNLGAALKTALIYLAHLKTLDETLKLGKHSRQKLLTLWADMPTTGSNPLYAQLFLTQSILITDPVFYDALGNYLSDSSILIRDHLPGLQAALNLTADEIQQILIDNSQTLNNAALTLANVSLLYRYRLLAKALKLSVSDLISLKALSGLNPFQSLHPISDPLTLLTLDQDYPLTQTLAFVEKVETVRASDFSVEDLTYLLRHRFDPVGSYRPDPNTFLALVKSLAAGLRQIHAEHAIPENIDSFTDDILQQKLNLVLPADVAAKFFGMWTGTIEYEAACTITTPLAPETFANEPAIRNIRYDEVNDVQRLTYRGVLTNAEKTRLNMLYPSATLRTLLDAVQTQAQTFFDTYLRTDTEGLPSYGFLAASDFEVLFTPPQPIPDDASEILKEAIREQNAEQLQRQRTILAHAFLPYLQETLSRQLVVQVLSTSLAAESSLTEALLTDENLLADASDQPLLPALTGLQTQGVTAEFFDETGSLLQAVNITEIDTGGIDPVTGDPIKPDGTTSIRFEGYLEVPTSGAYRFYGVCSQPDPEVAFHTEVALRFTHLSNPVFRGSASRDGAEIDDVVPDLKAGVPYQFTLDVQALDGGDVKLLILGETLPRGALSQLTLYPQATVECAHRTYTLLTKVLQLIQGFGFSEREVRHLLTHADDFDGLNLSHLPTCVAEDSPDNATTLFAQFLRLANYAQLKATLASETNDLISIFEQARRTFPTAEYTADQARRELFEDLCQRLAELTRRDAQTIQEVASQLGFLPTCISNGDYHQVEAPNYADEKGIQHFWDVLQVIHKIGVPVSALARWATPTPDFTIARDLRNTVKARYEPENWQRIAQPIFDPLRQRQRDALVAYVLAEHPEGFKSPNQLFEYFLIDPGMEPMVQTSRIRLAISAVQTFIQRCLLNLEPQVRPSAINSQHWEWMKRYRVWEANRKIFLYPENWLEPEFRDDKTHLFQELESALLQGDVSNELVEDAFFQYLKQLETIANLEIVTMYCEERSDNAEENVLHVIGRTANQPHQYFYRRYADGMWTPWEPVTTEIEGDHIVAAMWRGRLHLFWITFLEEIAELSGGGDDSDATLEGSNVAEVNAQASALSQRFVKVSLNWCEYFQGQWTTPESSGFGNPIRVPVEGNFNPHEVFVFVTKDIRDGQDNMTIHLSGETFNREIYVLTSRGYVRLGEVELPLLIAEQQNQTAFKLVSKNSPPQVVGREDPQESSYSLVPEINRYTGSGALQVTFISRTKTNELQPQSILREYRFYSLLTYSNPSEVNVNGIEALENRFFYQDDQFTFFVEPTLSERPDLLSDVGGTFIPVWEEDPDWVSIVAQGPLPTHPPVLREPLSALARYSMAAQEDWATDPALLVEFDGGYIGQTGKFDATAFATPAQGMALTGQVSVGGAGLQPFLLHSLKAQYDLNSDHRLTSGGFTNR